MFVLSVEGMAHMSRRNFSTHKILGVGERDDLIKMVKDDDDDVYILTNTETGEAERVTQNKL